MSNKFRQLNPKRTCTKSYGNYRRYKVALAKDFNRRCGYTDCSDFWFGGKDCFHIDHFIPWKKHPNRPELKTTYSNLVYSCSYVNILKSNDEGKYLDPCDVDYNQHFTRASDGAIFPVANSIEAKYMHSKLKLYLKRYQIIWMLDQIEIKLEQLSAVIDTKKIQGRLCEQELTLFYELWKEFSGFKKYLNGQ